MKATVYNLREERGRAAVSSLGRGILFTLLVVAICLYFTPAGYAVSNQVKNAWRYALLAVNVVSILVYLGRNRITIRWVSFVFFSLMYYVISSYVTASDGDVLAAFFATCKIIGYISLLEVLFSWNKRLALQAFVIAGIIMCGIHYWSFLAYRDVIGGMREGFVSNFSFSGQATRQHWFFFTHDNGSAFYFVPLLGIIWYRKYEENQAGIVAVLTTALILYMYWSLWSVTAMLATTFVVLAILAGQVFLRNARVLLSSYRIALVVSLAFCVSIILFFSSGILKNLEIFLRKSFEMARGYIWISSIELIKQSPIIGYGFESQAIRVMRFGIDHCHNIILQLLYNGGLLATIPFLLALWRCDPNVKVTTGEQRNLGLLAINATVVGLIVVSTFDWYPDHVIQYTPFILLAYTQQIPEHSDGNN